MIWNCPRAQVTYHFVELSKLLYQYKLMTSSRRTNFLVFLLLLMMGLFIAVMSLRFFNFEQQGVLRDKPVIVFQSTWYKIGFYLHVAAGIISLVIGPGQFLTSFRQRYPSAHRLIGKIYLVAVLTGGLSGLVICTQATGGIVSGLGFFFLSVGWLFTGTLAYRAIRSRNIVKHEQWMIRNYALTFAAVTLRLGLLLSVFGLMQFIVIYKIVAWASWIINLFAAEWIIARMKKGNS